MSQISIPFTGSSPIPPQIPTSFVTDNGTAVPAANIININGGTGATTSASGNTIVVTVKTDAFAWSDQAVSFNAAIQNGYFCTAALTATLPSAGLVNGSTVIIYVDTANSVVIQAAAGQQIEISQTSSSIGGTATSTAQGNIVTLVYRVSDTTWHSISTEGSFNFT